MAVLTEGVGRRLGRRRGRRGRRATPALDQVAGEGDRGEDGDHDRDDEDRAGVDAGARLHPAKGPGPVMAPALGWGRCRGPRSEVGRPWIEPRSIWRCVALRAGHAIDDANRAASVVRLDVERVEPVVVVVDRANLVAPSPLEHAQPDEDHDERGDKRDGDQHAPIQPDRRAGLS
jgi:hypothetical protein